ncbi:MULTISPECIES: Glu/Leu/Phe/Val family dehydrogenase [Sphingomonas]|uniref:Glu/Leu/Phe/Val family dehydrogenase n=1 Tax=Sphingomonas TaxID=13687 RepID=UPI002549F521|nr:MULTISPECIES: Glu/Leu/Phe/Val dehydrogenase dimerization domain-containing protein [Sphingomonas]MDK8184858.1 Glu/Leu/Phe/Val dehydrogenase dimerization domain-containing protein [Sphingomonas zeae]MDK8215579.1 Glu/Leu/Phe/Val dehydrogenase dimerization domain-containing protein [Sphingomonas sp. UMB7805-LC452B]
MLRPVQDRQSLPPEEVVTFHDRDSGASGVIVLHSSALGPAAGGCRLWHYPDDRAATVDALRLAEGMALKNALADLPFGGGKAVIRVPQRPFGRAALFRAFGRQVAELQGRYVTAEDVGTSVADMAEVATRTRHVAGLPASGQKPGGDPSPWTALGVLEAMRVAVDRQLGADLSDLTVAVQGLGHVGYALCELLHAQGAKLIVAEPRSDVAARAADRFGAMVMSSRALLSARVDVLAPCALGGVLDAETVAQLRASVVCGAANNQLAGEDLATRLAERDVLYAPDFLVNAGGIINVAGEYLGWSTPEVERRVMAVGQKMAAVLALADQNGITPDEAARALALERISQVSRAQAAA